MNLLFRKRAITTAISLAILSPATVFGNDVENGHSVVRVAQAMEEAKKLSTEPGQAISGNGDDDADNSSKESRVVITGSRIKRDSYTTSAPITTMDLTAIEDTGLSDLQDILVDSFPGISIGASNTTTQSSITQTGVSSVQLRNLGTDRTLILIDGRRVVANTDNGSVVSLSTIASGMIDRVEMLTGGASAVYGSDAVAGVINIITQSDKEGFEIKAKGGYRPEGGGEKHSIEFNYGTSFDDGNGYTYFSADINRDFGVHFNDHDRAQIQANHDYDEDEMCNRYQTQTNGRQCARGITQADWGNLDDGTAGGVFEEGNSFSDGGFWYDENNVLQTGWREERDGINSRQFVWIKTPIDRTNMAFKLDYDFGDLSAYFQVQYNNNESLNDKSPENDAENASANLFDPVTGAPAGRVSAGRIATDNPFAPALIADNAGSNITWDRRFFEVGQVTTDIERETVRTWGGLRGFVFDDAWEWDLSVGFGRFTQDLNRLNEIDIRKQNQALQSEQLADGTIQCIDPDARAAGCVPLNIFGVGSVTPEMADWIRVNPTIDIEIKKTNIVGYMTGDLFESSAGMASGAFGFEYRKDTTVLEASEGAQFGGISYNIVPNLDGEQTVKELFGEINFPLLRDLPGVKMLDLDASLRFADYSSNKVDLVKSYRVGVNWEFTDGYGFRVNASRSQRAPNIKEINGVPAGDFDNIDDICEGLTLTSVEPGHAGCLQDPVFAALFTADPSFVFEQDDGSDYSPNTGNPDLTEETADTLTVGFVLNPIENLNIAIDYFDIEIEDAIGSLDNEEILRRCYDSTVGFGADNIFCQDIERDEEGQLREVLQRDQNLNNLISRGVDVALNYRLDFNESGSLNFKLDYSHASEVSTTSDSADGLVTVREDGYLSIPKDRATASFVYRLDDWRLRWKTIWVGPMTDSQNYEEEYLGYVEANDERCAGADPVSAGCITNPEIPVNLYYPSYLRHDFSISYTMDLGSNQEMRLYGGMNNLFDNQGKFAPGSTGNSLSAYGRGTSQYAYVGVDYRF